MALLIGTGVSASGRQFDLDTDETVIGRASGLPITLEGANISRRHARIARVGNEFFIEDLGSSNGTYVNDRRITGKTRLVRNDLLRIGAFVFRFAPQPDPAADLTIQRETAALPGNTELYGENSSRKLQAVLQLAHDLGNTLDMDVLLNRFFDQMLKLFPKTERAVVFFFENGVPAIRHLREQQPGAYSEQLFSRAVLKQVLEKRSAVLAADTRTLSPDNTLAAMGVRSLLCVPLQAQGTPVFGGVQLERFKTEGPFTNDDLNLLTAISLQAAMALDKSRMHEQLLRQEQIGRELALAREIQLAFLPSAIPVLKGGPMDLVADLKPAEEVAGDFYDFMPLDDNRVLLVVADVSGKGMPAALFMSMVRALLRQASKGHDRPVEILRELNAALARDNPKFMFVTMVLAVYDVISGECMVARAGHPAPLLRLADGKIMELNCNAGSLVGIAEDCPPFAELKVQLSPGDTLIMYTDGLTEAANSSTGEMFGTARLLTLTEKISQQSPLQEYVSTFRTEVNRFCAPASPQDDITLLFLRHRPK